MEFENKVVEIADLPFIAMEEFEPLVPQQRWLSILNSVIFFVVLGLAAGLSYYFARPEIPKLILYIGAAFFLLLFLFRLLVVWKAFERKAYLLRNHDIVYRSGWINRKILTIPFNRIQHSEIRQSFLERMMEIARLKIYTAGGQSSDLTIPGLNPTKASVVRDFLIHRVSEYE